MSAIATALLAAVWYWLGGSFIGYTIYPIVISPTVIGMVFGFLYGDVTTGLIAGASLEVIYIGMVNAGGNLPADRMLAGLIAIPVVLQTGVDPQVAVSIAIPVGIIGVFLNNIRRTGNAFLIQKADKFAEECSCLRGKCIGRYWRNMALRDDIFFDFWILPAFSSCICSKLLRK